MGVRRVEDLVVWQLASELQKEVYEFTSTGAAWRDVRFREQIRDASASATRNTAEGFGRFRPKEFARFLAYAHGSLDETKDGLHTAHARNYLSDSDHQRLLRLAFRALAANAQLAKYLRNCPPDQFPGNSPDPPPNA